MLAIEQIGAVTFGEFTLKDGRTSPFYIDLRLLLGHPSLLRETARLLAELAAEHRIEFDAVLGVPYAAAPIATALALETGRPLLVLRKERKHYGAGGLLVGAPEPGMRCLVVDDLVTSGGSKLQTARVLEAEGLSVAAMLVLVDRSSGAADELGRAGYALHCLVSVDQAAQTLRDAGRITPGDCARIAEFVHGGSAEPAAPAPVAANPVAERIRAVMLEKQSNLVLSLDATSGETFFRILEATAPHVAVVKTHADVIDDFDQSFPARLTAAARRHGFLVLEDRKFADIGNTVRMQFRGGPLSIASWADCVTVHLISGEAILDGLFGGGGTAGSAEKQHGAFVLARMSSAGNLIDDHYTGRVIEIGRRRSECVAGYIGHGDDAADLARLKARIPAGQLLLVPGVKLEGGSDSLGQRYLTVEDAVAGGADGIIVGRGIHGDPDPGAAAARYRRRAWQALKKRGGQ